MTEPFDDAADGEMPALSEAAKHAFQVTQTPRQQELARQIYKRLWDGAGPEDVQDLVGRMKQLIHEENGGRERPAGTGGEAYVPPGMKRVYNAMTGQYDLERE